MIVHYDINGQIWAIENELGQLLVPETYSYIVVPDNIDRENLGNKYYIQDGSLISIGDPPTVWHSFDYVTKLWKSTKELSTLKEEKIVRINTWRTTANQGYFTFSDKQIACDQLSKDDINGVNGEVSLTGVLPDNFPMAWKCIDNTYVPIPDVATWTLFYKAMVQQGTTNFLRAQELKAAVASAASQEELDAITW